MLYFVYKTTNLINGKIYIGIHRTSNIDDGYLGSGKLLLQAIRKYGKENFKREIIEFVDNEDQLCIREAELVTEDFCKNSNTYNIAVGGGYGSEHKNGLTFRGRRHTPETIEKLKLFKRKPPTEEAKQKQRDNHFSKRYPEEFKRHVSAIASKPKSAEHRRKISETMKKRASIFGSKNKGLVRPKVNCPHCSKSGAIHVMRRFHFDKCKNYIPV